MVASRLPRALLVGAALAFVAVFFAYPVATILARGVGDEPDALAILGRSSTWSVLWFTLWQALLSAALTLVIGVPIAGALARFRFRGRGLVRVLVIVPFVLPTVVVATAFLAVAERFGLDEGPVRFSGTVWAILAAHVFFNVAVVVRTVGGQWAQLDPRQELAARTLGAGTLRVFRYVTFPRLRGAIVTAAGITFLFSFTSFGVILLLGGPRRATLETEIWRYATQRTEFGTAAVLAVIQLLAVGAMLLTYSLARGEPVAGERLRAPVQVERAPVGWREWAMVIGAVALVAVVIGLPLLSLVERSLDTGDGYGLGNYRALADQDERLPLLPVPAAEIILNSLRWAVMATVIATVIGGAAATSRSRGVEMLFLLPLGTSAVIVGFGMLVALDEPPLDFRSAWWIVPVAHAVIGIPFVMRTVSLARAAIDDRMREAAATLGASPRRTWREIDLPLMARGLAIGAAFAFTISLGEFGATAFLARPQRPTVPTAIFRLLSRPGELAFGQAMSLSVILAALTVVAVVVIERLRVTVSGDF